MVNSLYCFQGSCASITCAGRSRREIISLTLPVSLGMPLSKSKRDNTALSRIARSRHVPDPTLTMCAQSLSIKLRLHHETRDLQSQCQKPFDSTLFTQSLRVSSEGFCRQLFGTKQPAPASHTPAITPPHGLHCLPLGSWTELFKQPISITVRLKTRSLYLVETQAWVQARGCTDSRCEDNKYSAVSGVENHYVSGGY